VPAFKGLYNFPASICTSINQEIVHGIPSKKRVINEGDILSIDIGVRLEGYYTDSATTVAVGRVDEKSQRLLDVTREALAAGIAAATPDNHLGDIGAAVQEVVESAGFSVVKDLVGHGIGVGFHEEPQVPNYGKPKRGVRLTPGLTIAIEPMVNVGKPETRTMPDRWTVVSVDGTRSAHFEHTVAVTENGPRVLTALGA
jgi:methionyl aminopeptidase